DVARLEAARAQLLRHAPEIAGGARAAEHAVVRDLALHEELQGPAVGRRAVFQLPRPHGLRAARHARRARLEVRDLPLAGERRVGLRVLAAQDLEVAPVAVADRRRDVPARITAGLDPHHLIRPVAVVQAPLAVPWIVVRPRDV